MSTKTLEELADSFGLFDNWEDRYRYLIDLGKRLPVLDESEMTEDYSVKGCTSQVWLVPEIIEGEDGKKILTFRAGSDAQIVRGLIYILMLAYNNVPLSEIDTIDIEEAFERLGLGSHLSPNRRNGFFAMVSHIRAFSRQ